MPIDAQDVERIYSGSLARTYDSHVSRLFGKYKRRAFAESSLKQGDRVLVFCCGTGLDFECILERIGAKGAIVGVDFSAEMLRQAEQRVAENAWENVELIQADATSFKDPRGRIFDAGVCTLGISIIPDHMAAYRRLASQVRVGGELIIGDMQLASGWRSLFNWLTVFMARKFGGSRTGHRNSAELRAVMRAELSDMREEEYFLGSYFYCVGRISRAERVLAGPD
jgi:demethylmenaquinone methyltransferase/2-methoxy-6-polyprenyl-1,4-benzoquinol methylase